MTQKKPKYYFVFLEILDKPTCQQLKHFKAALKEIADIRKSRRDSKNETNDDLKYYRHDLS